MTEARATLSLADVAKLAGVQRPVVTMWRKRALDGMPFPAPDGEGRFSPEEIVDWLEATGRGNNPAARADLAIWEATSGSVSPRRRSELIALLGARALLDEPVSSYDVDELLDEIDALDPDDSFLFSEVEAIETSSRPVLAAQADAIADAAWHPRAAYERLFDAQPGPSHDDRLAQPLLAMLAALCRALIRPGGDLIDLQGRCSDVVVEAWADEDLPIPSITVPCDEPDRAVLRRYRVHSMEPTSCGVMGDWACRPGSVALIRVSEEAGFDLIDEARLQLAADGVIMAVGPAALLTDALPHDLEARRDEFVRQDPSQPALLRAAVRLPAGLIRSGSREHLALWLLGPEPRPAPIWVGDLSGLSFDLSTRQALLDDLVAVAHRRRGRAFTTLQAAQRATIAVNGGALVSTGRASACTVTAAAADDATRLEELRHALNAPMPVLLGQRSIAVGHGETRQIRVDDALRAKHLRLISGTRIGDLSSGSTPLWTSAAVAERRPVSVDLLSLTRQHPDARLTQPRDIVFTTAGKPAAVLDLDGGAAVAYPARVLRVTGGRLCPAAIADAVNAVPAGNSKWRTWMVPEVQMDPAAAGDILESLQDWEKHLRQRQTLLDELRTIITRSVLSGAVTVTTTNDQKGS